MKGINFSTPTEQITGLAWGMHGQFRDYIARMPDGQTSVHDGAVALPTGETCFAFDAASSTDGELRFRGRLQFRGHRGMLAVSIEDPWIQLDDPTPALTIVDPFEPAMRMPLAVVDLQPDGAGTTRLTEAGTDLFMGNYSENTLFDPVRILWAEKEERYDHVR